MNDNVQGCRQARISYKLQSSKSKKVKCLIYTKRLMANLGVLEVVER